MMEEAIRVILLFSSDSRLCNFCSSSVCAKYLRNAATSTSRTSARLLSQFPGSFLSLAGRYGGAIVVPRHTIVNFSHRAQKGPRGVGMRMKVGERGWQTSERRITSKYLHALIVGRTNREITGCKPRTFNARGCRKARREICLAQFLSEPINHRTDFPPTHHPPPSPPTLSRNVNVSDARNNLQFFSRSTIKRYR